MTDRPFSRYLSVSLLALCLTLLPGCTRAGIVDPGGPAGGSRPERLEWCGMLELPDRMPDGRPLGGLSELAFDPDSTLLYMLSDRARLYRARPHFDDRQQLSRLELLDSTPLRDHKGQPLEMPRADSESMVLIEGNNGETQLLIGFERQHRLQRFTTDGRPLGKALQPSALAGAAYNGSLEALANSPVHGIIAGLEFASQGMAANESRLFDLDGRQWRWQRAGDNSGLTAMAPLDDDLLLLERDFEVGRPLTISLRRARITDTPQGSVVPGDTIARLASDEGWRLDNFEGLTRIAAQRYLMVSDDNFSWLQRSLLACFELPDEAGPGS
ncbi:esterase-like activity of phytase family protein [Kushneria sp. AK178]